MTGEVRIPPASEQHPGGSVQVEEGAIGGASGGAVQASGAELDQLRAQLEERTADLQRVSAEYSNYRRRVERDRQVVGATAKAQIASELLTVLDDIERAEAHGDLSGAFKAVADKLIAGLTTHGLQAFGSVGNSFDPGVHEAVQHHTSPDVQGPTVTAVLRRGYRFGDRVLRPAMVVVTDAEPTPDAAAANSSEVSPDAARFRPGDAAGTGPGPSGAGPGGAGPSSAGPGGAGPSGAGPGGSGPGGSGPGGSGPVPSESDQLTGSTGASSRGGRSAQEE